MPISDFTRRYNLLRRFHSRGDAARYAGDLGRRLPDPYLTTSTQPQGAVTMTTRARPEAKTTPDNNPAAGPANAGDAIRDGEGGAAPVAPSPSPVSATPQRVDPAPSGTFYRVEQDTPPVRDSQPAAFQVVPPPPSDAGAAAMDIIDRETGESVHLEARPQGDGQMEVTASGRPGPLMDATEAAMRDVAHERNGGGGEPDPAAATTQPAESPSNEAIAGLGWRDQPPEPDADAPMDAEPSSSPTSDPPESREPMDTDPFAAVFGGDPAPPASSSSGGSGQSARSTSKAGDTFRWRDGERPPPASSRARAEDDGFLRSPVRRRSGRQRKQEQPAEDIKINIEMGEPR